MGSAGKHVPFLLLLVIISSLHTEARIGQFFMYAPVPAPQAAPVSPAAAPIVDGGFVSGPELAPSPGNAGYAPAPVETADDVTPAPSVSPAAAPIVVSVPGLAPSQGDTGSAPAPVETAADDVTPTEYSVSSNKDEILVADENLNADQYSAGSQYYYSSNVGSYPDNYNDNNMADSNRGYSYSDNVYGQKEVSDTRYSDNSKYSYDVNSEQSNTNGNEAAEEDRYNSDAGIFGYGEKSKYEYENMEEYERLQGYPDTDRLYNP